MQFNMTPDIQAVMLTQILKNQENFEKGEVLPILNIDGNIAEKYDVLIKMTVELKPKDTKSYQ
jgi:hypothetical protein